MGTLTVKGVEALMRSAGGGKEYHPDGDGLYLRVRKSGHGTYVLRQPGHPSTKVCDAILGLAEARRLAMQMRVTRARGEERKKAPTVAAVYEDYLRRYLTPRLRSAYNVDLTLRREMLPRWGKLEVTAVTRSMIAGLVHAVADRGTPRAANLLLAHISGFCRWMVGMGLIPANPAAGIPRAVTNGARERVLSEQELRLIWNAGGSFERLLITTGLRKSEVGKAVWSEIDLAAKTWTIPPTRMKNKRPHVFPLTDGMIAALPPRGGDDRLFRGDPGGAVEKRRLDARLAEKIPHWTFHDIRRSVATHLGDMGVPPHVIECCLAHIGGFRAGVAGTYNRSSYWPEMVDAFNRWDARLRVIVTGADNVVALPVKGRA
jgi:integrase